VSHWTLNQTPPLITDLDKVIRIERPRHKVDKIAGLRSKRVIKLTVELRTMRD
jgi:hypothetical protein